MFVSGADRQGFFDFPDSPLVLRQSPELLSDFQGGGNQKGLRCMSDARKIEPGHLGGIDRLQVGCGPQHVRDDWWNVDVRAFQGIDEVMDVTLPWRWRSCLNYVYGEHFLEHLEIRKAHDFLCQAHAALKSGGKIRLSTPSLEWVLSTHFDLNASDSRMAIEQTLAVNRAFYGWGHRFLYSRPMLVRVLSACGFTEIKFFAYGESDTPSLRGIECHGGFQVSNGFPSVWIAEGTKLNGDRPGDDEFSAQIYLHFDRHVESGH